MTSRISEPELVIFDCDGVLVDSEVLVIEVESRLLTEAGFPISMDELSDRCVGLNYRDMMAMLANDFGRPIPERLSEEIQAAALAEFPERLEPVRGMTQLLASLKSRRCVASSSDVDRLTLSLGLTQLDAFFDPAHVYSAQMVEQGKPEPDLFLFAAEQCGVEPQSCLVLEDSPHGVTAGVAAGMEVVGFVGGRHARPTLRERLTAAGATTVIDHPSELAARLA